MTPLALFRLPRRPAPLLAGLFLLVPAAGAQAPGDPPLELPAIALTPAFGDREFERPLFVAWPDPESPLACVVEQRGRILLAEDRLGAPEPSVFLDLREVVRLRHNEEGLLSLAFHPRFRDNGFCYVYYSASRPRRGVVSRFRVDPSDPRRADPGSETVILEVPQPWGNHNGCTVLFGPDGYFYLSLGDGGAADDPLNSGQDLSTLLGTILRIDVDRREGGKAYAVPDDNPFVGSKDARPEIWAYGLRNVWRMSFDRETGELWAGDVGQNKWEEIDLIVKGGNYGWNLREGAHSFRDGDTDVELLDPVIEYPHSRGLSVTGGYVYRGREIEGLNGAYLYADYLSKRFWALRHQGGQVRAHREVLAPADGVYAASFAERPDGELYVCGYTTPTQQKGRIYRIVAAR